MLFRSESNPLLETWSTPFGVPPFDKIKTEHFKPAVEAGIRLHEAQIDSIVKNTETPSFGNVIEALDRSGEVLNNAYTVFSLLNSAESNDRMQADDMEISPLVSAHNVGQRVADGTVRQIPRNNDDGGTAHARAEGAA